MFKSSNTRADVVQLTIAILVLSLVLLSSPVVSGAATIPTLPTDQSPMSTASPSRKVYGFYYLWWSRDHWKDMLGPSFPYTQSPLPLPAGLGSDECHPTSLYIGNKLTDVAAQLYSQDDPGVIERDVRRAAQAGLVGFIANWRGTGLAGQLTSDLVYNRRLAELVRAVNEVNTEGIRFKLWFNYRASHDPTLSEMSNDWAYLQRTYGLNKAFDRSFSTRPILIWNATNTYSTDTLKAMSQQFRTTFFMVGNESWDTWTATRAQYLDGNQYYWSTQNPYTNPGSFTQLQTLADKVRASAPNPDGSKKRWFAPFTPGYNSLLAGGNACVPRKGGKTMRSLFNGNAATHPDAWTFISWNEITEGSYIQPLRRYGNYYLNVLADIIGGT